MGIPGSGNKANKFPKPKRGYLEHAPLALSRQGTCFLRKVLKRFSLFPTLCVGKLHLWVVPET